MASGDAQDHCHVRFFEDPAPTKAVGEPPFVLAIWVRETIRDAIAAFGDNHDEVSLHWPATNNVIFVAMHQRRGAKSGG